MFYWIVFNLEQDTIFTKPKKGKIELSKKLLNIFQLTIEKKDKKKNVVYNKYIHRIILCFAFCQNKGPKSLSYYDFH